MEIPHIYNWLQYDSHIQADFNLEPPILDSTTLFVRSPSACSAPTKSVFKSISDRRRSRRVRPYSILTRELRKNTGEMSNKSYETWPSPNAKGGSGRSHFSGGPTSSTRRASIDDRQVQPSYTLSNAFTAQSTGDRSSTRIDPRPQSPGSNTTSSSLTGAMGNTHISPHSQPPGSVCQTDAAYMQGVAWTTNQHRASSVQTPYTGIQEQSGNMPYHDLSSLTTPSTSPYLQYQSNYQNPSPGSPPRSTSSYPEQQFTYRPVRPLSPMRTPVVASSTHPEPYSTPAALPQHTPSHPNPANSFSTPEQYQNEIIRLRKKIDELQSINQSIRLRQKDSAGNVGSGVPGPSHNYGDGQIGGPPGRTPSSQSAEFQASWKRRTDARVRQFCSLNRAGNALCAWHDSRRERRAYPPRMAPPGYLNCGCTFEEALFEESLSRANVGSYHPGESVRMDPALRNPLLKLLQTRYGYRDGDFERDINTGLWIEGEGPEMWDHSAPPNVRKKSG